MFSKALEISPDHAEAILYRGLSKGWQSKGNACYLNVTDAAFKKVYLQNRSNLTEDQKSAELDFLGYDSSYSPCEIEYGKTGCYIATAVYGSYDCPQVWTLRRYRDYTLGENWAGRLFIKVYYAISPTIVKIFGKTKWFNSFWKKVLDKKVQKLQLNGVESTPYVDKVWRKGQYRHHDENNDK